MGSSSGSTFVFPDPIPDRMQWSRVPPWVRQVHLPRESGHAARLAPCVTPRIFAPLRPRRLSQQCIFGDRFKAFLASATGMSVAAGIEMSATDLSAEASPKHTIPTITPELTKLIAQNVEPAFSFALRSISREVKDRVGYVFTADISRNGPC